MKSLFGLETQQQFVRVYNYHKERADRGEHVTWQDVQDDMGINNDRNLRALRTQAEATFQCKFPAFNQKYSPRRFSKLPFGTLEIESDNPIVLPTCSDVHAWPTKYTPITDAFRVYLNVLEELAKDHEKELVVVVNGDMFDGASISRHPSIRWEYKPSVKEELDACKEYAEAIERAVEGHPNVRLVWVWGNHDERFDSKLANMVGEFKDIEGFSLVDHFPRWEFTQALLVNHCAYFVHDVHAGKHAAYNNVQDFGPNVHVFTGHTHRLTTRTKTFFTGRGKATETGTLCDIGYPQFQYVRGNPVDWQPGFVVVNIHGQHCHEELVEVDTHAMWRGEDWL